MSFSKELMDTAEKWLLTKRATTDPAILSAILHRTQNIWETNGGYLSVSHVERAYLELCAAGEIPRIAGTMHDKLEANAIPQDLINYIERTPARELQRRYNSDATFRAQYDAYEASKRSQQQQQSQEAGTLTAEAYHRIPAVTIARKYQSDVVFRAQVDALIKRGEI